MKETISHIPSSTVQANKIEPYTLTMRGNSINPIIEAATPLLGMVLRIQDLTISIADPQNLYRQLVSDIQEIESKLVYNYEPSISITFRYVLCTFIDECVMSTRQALSQYWSKKSLLIHFHNESWGGEKVYQVLDRILNEPQRYKDLLEFFYTCFCLGFRGRYKVQNANSEEFERIFRRLHNVLQSLNEPPSPTYFHLGRFKNSVYQLSKFFDIKHIMVGGTVTLAVIYAIYYFKLNAQSNGILEQLSLLLN